MPQTGDLVKVDYVIDVNSVETLTKQIFFVDDVGGADSIAKITNDLATLFWAAFAPLLSPVVKLSCVKWVNLDRAEKAVVNPNLPGTGAVAPHPSHMTLFFNTYGHGNDVDPLKRNQHYISGLAKDYSTRGRLNDESLLVAPEIFLATLQQTDVAGVDLIPQIRWGGTPGPPTTYSYDDVDFARGNPDLTPHRSRKFRTCV